MHISDKLAKCSVVLMRSLSRGVNRTRALEAALGYAALGSAFTAGSVTGASSCKRATGISRRVGIESPLLDIFQGFDPGDPGT
jgi:hypothetical protein